MSTKVKVEVVKVQVKTKEELTIKLLTTPVGEGIRMNNQEIVDELIKAFGSGSINCVRWYSSKLRKDMSYAIKYDIPADQLKLTPRVKQD